MVFFFIKAHPFQAHNGSVASRQTTICPFQVKNTEKKNARKKWASGSDMQPGGRLARNEEKLGGFCLSLGRSSTACSAR
jgi:hypothetical protein